MLNAILKMSTLKDLESFSREMSSKDFRTSLYKKITEEGYVLCAEDLLVKEVIDECTNSKEELLRVLVGTSVDSDSRKIVRRLQLVTVCNLASKRSVNMFLRRACI